MLRKSGKLGQRLSSPIQTSLLRSTQTSPRWRWCTPGLATTQGQSKGLLYHSRNTNPKARDTLARVKIQPLFDAQKFQFKWMPWISQHHSLDGTIAPIPSLSLGSKLGSRLYSTGHSQNDLDSSNNTSISSLQVTGEESLEIGNENGNFMVPLIWLRDHCRSARFYNASTNQKNPDADLLTMDLTPDKVDLSGDRTSFAITWKDGHTSDFSLDWLRDNFYPGKFCKAQRTLWSGREMSSKPLPCVSYRDHMATDAGLAQTLKHMVEHGFVLVTEAPVSIDGTQAVVERICPVMETLFGGMWSFSADSTRSDTAYTTQHIGSHTDNAYLDSPAGVQVFQCLKHDGQGGENFLVDGFRAIEQLRQSNPKGFRILSETIVPSEYKEMPGPNSPGYHTYSLGPVISVHPASGEVLQMRYNPYDRAPLNTLDPKNMRAFYEAFNELQRIIEHEDSPFWLKLKPGNVLLVDNWRLTHARTSFDGHRVMCGCYLDRDYWTSKARMFGLM